MNKVRITLPKAIWSDPRRLNAFLWESYGRYLKPNGQVPQAELDIEVKCRWF